ncbi:MAG: sigma-70 family RNA polymerase sigma factor [Comamonadaceae bacterium]|nr:sigma-70 family RNA polymerase sigma factor [Comamonadaceae bacterium]
MPSSHAAAQTFDLGRLHAVHHDWLVAWLRTRVGNPADAADLAQEVFLRLLRQPDLQALREPRAYLATVGKRLALNLHRRRQLEAAYLEALAALPQPLALSPEEHCLLRETVLELDALLSALGPKVKRAFLLAQFEGLGYAAIARDIGVTPRTVVNYVARAMAHCCLHAPPALS